MLWSNNLSKAKEENGFTLVELMWAALLTVMLVASVFGALQVGMKASTSASKVAQFVDQGTTAMRVMERYLRQAMVLAETDRFYIRISTEKGTEDNEYITVEYYLYNGVLYQRIEGKESKLAENVRNAEKNLPLFVYLDENGSEITDPTLRQSETRIIKINLYLDDDLAKDPAGIYLTSQVSLRNFNL